MKNNSDVDGMSTFISKNILLYTYSKTSLKRTIYTAEISLKRKTSFA